MQNLAWPQSSKASPNTKTHKPILKPTAIDLFSGAGGFSLGLEQAGFNVLAANEIHPRFAASYRLNHPNTRMINCAVQDLSFKQLKSDLKLEDLTLLAGGPPCQGFSTVGSKSKSDPRNSLFEDYLRAVQVLNPAHLIFENVSGFRSLYNGMAFERLTSRLTSLGYQLWSDVLNTSDYGLPQHRKRTIVLGWKSKNSIPKPRKTHGTGEGQIAPLTLMEAISDLPPLKSGQHITTYLHPPQNPYQMHLRGTETTLSEHNCASYGERMQEILSHIPPCGSVKDLPLRLRPQSCFGNTYARLQPDRPAPTITRNFGTPSSSRCVHPHQNRALSTREGARLQGFPDSYRFLGGKVDKNLQIGNAVPPILAYVVAKEIHQSLGFTDEKPGSAAAGDTEKTGQPQ